MNTPRVCLIKSTPDVQPRSPFFSLYAISDVYGVEKKSWERGWLDASKIKNYNTFRNIDPLHLKLSQNLQNMSAELHFSDSVFGLDMCVFYRPLTRILQNPILQLLYKLEC